MTQRKVLVLGPPQSFDELVADDLPPGGGAVDSVNGQTGVVVLDAGDVGADVAGAAASAQSAAIAASQPVDSDLTAIAALTTTAFGRALLALADPADATKFLNGSGAFSVPAGGAADPNLNLFLLSRYR